MGLVGLGKELVFHTRGNGLNVGRADPFVPCATSPWPTSDFGDS